MNAIDLVRVLSYLRPGAKYRLSSSVPPHRVVDWRGPGTLPKDAEIISAWEDIKGNSPEVPIDIKELEGRVALLEKEVFSS